MSYKSYTFEFPKPVSKDPNVINVFEELVPLKDVEAVDILNNKNVSLERRDAMDDSEKDISEYAIYLGETNYGGIPEIVMHEGAYILIWRRRGLTST